MKRKIFIDFELIVTGETDVANNLFELTANEDNINLLKALNIYYEVFIFTKLERKKVYKWLIKNHLDVYVKDVVNRTNPNSLFLSPEFLKFQDDYTDKFWR